MFLLLSRLIAAGILLLNAGTAAGQTWDLLIRNATVVDGTGVPEYRADLAVRGGRVVRIGRLEGSAKREIDASGLVAAPGFIDAHTHAEGILETPRAENFLRMGVTTVVAGNCGASEPNVGQYLRALERAQISANVATLIGHNTIRRMVVGETEVRAATAAELSRMKSLVEQAMKEGALGLSTGLIYAPGKFSSTAEIIELARVAAAYGGIYATHVRDEGEGLLGALEEAFQVGKEARIPVELSHLKLSGNLISPQKAATIQFLEGARQEGLADKVIAAIQAARRSGIQVSQDLYPYSAASASILRLLPESARKLSRDELRARLKYAGERRKMAEAMKADLRASGHTNYAHAVIVAARRFKSLQGLTVWQAARERSGNDSLEAQINVIQDLAAAGDVSIIVYELNEADLVPLMRLPNTIFISDTGTSELGKEPEHPRGFGSAARVLAKYVRTEKQLALEEAVRRMTSLPASTFHLKDRGVIREGAWADLVLFDPRQVQDQATFANPHLFATGYKYVFVNGVITIEDDQHTWARAGRALRRGE